MEKIIEKIKQNNQMTENVKSCEWCDHKVYVNYMCGEYDYVYCDLIYQQIKDLPIVKKPDFNYYPFGRKDDDDDIRKKHARIFGLENMCVCNKFECDEYDK